MDRDNTTEVRERVREGERECERGPAPSGPGRARRYAATTSDAASRLLTGW